MVYLPHIRITTLISALLFFSTNIVLATTTIAFGPKIYERATAAPITVTDQFSYPRPGDICTIQIHNGGFEDDTFDLISSTIITFNGPDIFTPNEFNQQVNYLEKKVVMAADNTLTVLDRSKPGAALGIIIVCDKFDTTPPQIVANISPNANNQGWHNTDAIVSFICTDADSDITFCTAPIAVVEEGDNQIINGQAQDSAGNMSSTSASINLDKTAPTITPTPLTQANTHGWYNSDVTISFECHDTLSGVAQCPVVQTITTEGIDQLITGSTSDIADNINSANLSLNIDKTAPTITAELSETANAQGWHNSNVTITFVCKDSGSGIDVCPSPITLTTNGASQKLSASAIDLAGNTATTNVTLNIDKTLPLITATPVPIADLNGWNNTDVIVTFTCTDTGSGIASCSDPVTISNDGANQSATGQAVDISGNIAETSIAINLDKIAPTISATQIPVADTNGWNDSNVEINYSCSDATSGVALCPSATSFVNEGSNQSVTVVATDIASNQSTNISTVNIDKYPPTIVAKSIPLPNKNGWNNTDVIVRFTCNDTGSGIAGCTAPTRVTTEGAAQIIDGLATDVSGKTASTLVSLNIDKTPPIITVTTPLNGSNLSTLNTIVRGQVTDDNAIESLLINGERVALDTSNQFNHDISLAKSLYQIELVATDIANNQSSKVVSLIAPGNLAPEIVSTPNTSAVESTLFTYDVDAIDPNADDILTYSLEQSPADMTIDSLTGDITWIADANYVGTNALLNTACVDPNIPDLGTLDAVVKWHWSKPTYLEQYNQVMSTPVVAQLNDDNGDGQINTADIPDVIFTTFTGNRYRFPGILRAISGATGEPIWNIPDQVAAYPGPAVGDIDGDGLVEIVVPGPNLTGLKVFENDGRLKWTVASTSEPNISTSPSIADLDNDGSPEIIFGARVFNANGSLLWGYGDGERFPLVADFDMDGDMEIFSAGTLYDHQGTPVWSTGKKLLRGAVGNFDDDDFPEIVALEYNYPDETLVYMLNHDGSILKGPISASFTGGGAVTVADVDADGEAEFGIASQYLYVVFETDGSIKWANSITDASSGGTGSSVFDFEGDGKAEILYNDEYFFRIYDGETGEIRYQLANPSGTITEYPVVVDIDNDNHAEVVLVSNNYAWGVETGVRVLQGVNDNWSPTRSIWNQHAYHITNVNDDGTIPIIEKHSWLTHNTYRLNAFLEPQFFTKADLRVSDVLVAESETGLTLSASVTNRGLLPLSETATVNFYNSDPAKGGILLGSTVTNRLGSGAQQTVSISDVPISKVLSEIFVAVDENNQINECIENNNTTHVPVVWTRAQDLGGLFDKQVFAVNVENTNSAPSITSTPTVSVVAGDTYQYQVTTQDQDIGDAVLYTLLSGPKGLQINRYTGLLTWIPVIADAGSHVISVQIEDLAKAAETQTFTLTVDIPNRPPVFTSTPIISTTQLTAYIYNAEAIDPDPDNEVVYALATAPPAMLIDQTTGQISWLPELSDVGNFNISITATDMDGAEAVQNFVLYVAPAPSNLPPVITSTAVTTAAADRLYSYDVEATDPDGDNLTYSLSFGPQGMSIDSSTGLIQWTPSHSQTISSSEVSVHVYDELGESATQTFTINAIIGTCTVLDEIVEPVILTDWVVEEVPGSGGGGTWSWQVDAAGTTVTQAANARTSNFLSLVDYSTQHMRGIMRVDDLSDDDHIGISFGYQDQNHYYFLYWENGRYMGSTGNIYILRANNDLIYPYDDLDAVYYNPIPQWQPQVTYTYDFEFREGGFDITIKQGDQLVDNISVEDSTFTTGRFGFINHSQPMARYTANTVQTPCVKAGENHLPKFVSSPVINSLLGSPYQYQAIAKDADVGDTISYTLTEAPAGMVIDSNSGLITWDTPVTTPTWYRVSVQAQDNLGAYITQSYFLHVITSNVTPSINSTPVTVATANIPYVYDVDATDSDNDALSYDIGTPLSGMSIDHVTGVINWIPNISQVGLHELVVRVNDGVGVAVQVFSVTVLAPAGAGNNNPTITSIPTSTSTSEGLLYTYDVDASDPDGNPLTYSLTLAPSGMSIDAITGVINWTPLTGQTGNFSVSILVSDSFGGIATQNFSVNVGTTTSNVGPTIISTPSSLSATEGQLYSYDVDATDPDGDILSYSLTVAPTGMSIDAASGLISWTPTVGQIGSQNFNIFVDDLRGGTASQNVTVVVNTATPNVGPSINSTPIFNAKSGYEYVYQIIAADTNNDTLNYSFISAPNGMTISPAGEISWTPTAADIGTHSITVRVDDSALYAEQSWVLTVIDGVIPITANVSVTPTSVNVGESVTITVTADNSAGTITRNATLDGMPITLDENGVAVVTIDAIGPHEVVASVTDTSGSDVVNVTIYALDPSDTTPPLVKITAPATDATVTTTIDISGYVTEQNLSNYRLVSFPAGSTNYTVIAEGSTAFPDQVIATLDTTIMINGLYTIVLEATDQNGQTTTDSIGLLVDGNLKVGNFSFTVVDLEIPVSGIPIRVTRTYDSRRRSEDLDFGYAWSVGYQDAKVEESRTPGVAWALNEYPSGPLGLVPLWCVEPLGKPRVTVTLPNGETETFNVKATPECSQAQPVLDVHLNFVADRGTLGTLEIQNNALLRLVNGNLDVLGDSTSFDPDIYIYTSKDGYKYTLDQDFGIKTVEDSNGNTLTYTNDGIIHSDGKSVLFNRDALGRIVSITDPMQNIMHYDYSGTGDLLAFTDLENNTTTYTYNSNHGLVEIIDPLGRGITKNIYDDSGRLIAQENADGIRTEYTHDIAGRESVVSNRRGYITRFFYDERGNVTVKVNADGATVYEYDADDNLLSTMNPLGEMTYGTFDDRRNQLTYSDDLGNTITFEHNSRGLETKIVYARNNLPVEFTYDVLGNLTETIDRAGNMATQIVNVKGQVKSRTNVLLGQTSFTYDANGNKATETDSEGNTTSFSYDDNGNVKSETRIRTVNGLPVTEITLFEYDKLNRIIKTTDALNNVTRVEYDQTGNESAEIDARNLRTSYDYDAYRRLIKTTYPDLTTEESQYDAEGNMIASIDRLKRITRYQYDAMDRQIKITYPDGTFSQTEYDAAGRSIAIIDARGNRTEHQYDRAGRRIKTIDANFNETVFSYDADGNLLSQLDANNHLTQYEYDVLDRRILTTYHDNSSVQEQYDALGRTTAKIDQSNRPTTYQYDSLSRLTKVIDALLHETTYTYDEAGNKISQTDANLNTTTWTYDAIGRVESRMLPEGQIETFIYDNNGNISAHTDFNQNSTSYDYDENDRLITTTYQGGSTESNTYTITGNLATATDQRGTTQYTYDSRDRMLTETQANGIKLGYDYDASGNRILVQNSVLNPQTQTSDTNVTTYNYDSLNRLYTVTDDDNQITTYGYDLVGNRISVSYPNSTTSNYTYDTLNRLKSVQTLDSSNVVISQYDYSLYSTGQRQTATDLNGTVTAYIYDDVYRLTNEEINHPTLGKIINDYQYDPVGNRISSSENGVQILYSYNANDHLITAGGRTYTYDDNGNTLTINDTTSIITNGYDLNNRLISVTKTIAGTQTENISYVYDINGVRVAKNNNGLITNYIVDKNRDYAQVIREIDDSNVVQVSYTYGDDLISQNRFNNSNYYHYDGLGSTRTLTDNAGILTDTYDYNAYGQLINSSGTTLNNYLFTGEQFDSSLNQYYLRARYYDTGIGRFTQMDSWMGRMNEPATLHKYVYGNGDPINNIDPSGYETIQGQMQAIGVSGILQASIRAATNSFLYIGRALVAAGTHSLAAIRKEILKCQRTKGKKCRIPNMVIIGSDFPESQKHIADAQLGKGSNGFPISPVVTYKRGANKSRSWLASTNECRTKLTKSQPVRIKPKGKDCDEYPFAASYQGGRKKYRQKKVSLRIMTPWDNQGSGRVWGNATRKNSQRKKFIIAPTGPASFYIRNGTVGR